MPNSLLCLAGVILLGFCRQLQAAVVEGEMLDQNGAPLSSAVITVEPRQPPTGPFNYPRRDVLDQRNREFFPHVLVVHTGTEVSFPNHDKIRHHVYSFSPVKRFELKLYKEVTPTPILFDTPGVAVLGCNIHDWMLSYVYVTDTPFFTQSDNQGHWRLDLPVGEYTLNFWHPYMDIDQAIMPETLKINDGANILLHRKMNLKNRYRTGKPPAFMQEEGYQIEP